MVGQLPGFRRFDGWRCLDSAAGSRTREVQSCILMA